MDNKQAMDILTTIKSGDKDAAKKKIDTFLFDASSRAVRDLKTEMAKTMFAKKDK